MGQSLLPAAVFSLPVSVFPLMPHHFLSGQSRKQHRFTEAFTWLIYLFIYLFDFGSGKEQEASVLGVLIQS